MSAAMDTSDGYQQDEGEEDADMAEDDDVSGENDTKIIGNVFSKAMQETIGKTTSYEMNLENRVPLQLETGYGSFPGVERINFLKTSTNNQISLTFNTEKDHVMPDSMLSMVFTLPTWGAAEATNYEFMECPIAALIESLSIEIGKNNFQIRDNNTSFAEEFYPVMHAINYMQEVYGSSSPIFRSLLKKAGFVSRHSSTDPTRRFTLENLVGKPESGLTYCWAIPLCFLHSIFAYPLPMSTQVTIKMRMTTFRKFIRRRDKNVAFTPTETARLVFNADESFFFAMCIEQSKVLQESEIQLRNSGGLIRAHFDYSMQVVPLTANQLDIDFTCFEDQNMPLRTLIFFRHDGTDNVVHDKFDFFWANVQSISLTTSFGNNNKFFLQTHKFADSNVRNDHYNDTELIYVHARSLNDGLQDNQDRLSAYREHYKLCNKTENLNGNINYQDLFNPFGNGSQLHSGCFCINNTPGMRRPNDTNYLPRSGTLQVLIKLREAIGTGTNDKLISVVFLHEFSKFALMDRDTNFSSLFLDEFSSLDNKLLLNKIFQTPQPIE